MSGETNVGSGRGGGGHAAAHPVHFGKHCQMGREKEREGERERAVVEGVFEVYIHDPVRL